MEPLPELTQRMDLPAVLAEVEAGALRKEAHGPGPYSELGLDVGASDTTEAGGSSSGSTDKPQGEYLFECNITSPCATGNFPWLCFLSWVCFMGQCSRFQFFPSFHFSFPEETVSHLTPAGEERAQSQRTYACLLYTSPSPRDLSTSRMPSSA